MSSRTPRTSNRRASRQPEPEDPYASLRRGPRQSHAGYLLAFASVLAVLGFGFWSALGTFAGSGDKPASLGSLPIAATTSTATATAVVVVPDSTATPTGAAASATRSATGTPTGGRVHVVGEGDTLYRIAQRYGTTVEAIMAANGFTDRSKILHIGDRLTIP